MKADASSYEDAYRGFYEAALNEPMAWFHLDSDFLDDSKIMRLGYVCGWERIGIYVGLMSRLAREPRHILDVSDDYGWLVLQNKLSLVGRTIPIDDLKDTIGAFAELGLIDGELYEESRRIASDRLLREAENFADKAAKGKCQGAAMRKGKEDKAAGRS